MSMWRRPTISWSFQIMMLWNIKNWDFHKLNPLSTQQKYLNPSLWWEWDGSLRCLPFLHVVQYENIAIFLNDLSPPSHRTRTPLREIHIPETQCGVQNMVFQSQCTHLKMSTTAKVWSLKCLFVVYVDHTSISFIHHHNSGKFTTSV
jgi:hypothetical protein